MRLGASPELRGIFIVFAAWRLADAKFLLPSKNTGSDLVCRLVGDCLDYSAPDSLGSAVTNLPFEGPSLHLDLNYAGQYDSSSREPKHNLCIADRLAPTFFLLGAQKAATTNFAARFAQVALSVVPPKPLKSDPSYFWKELHVFDDKERYSKLGLQGWLDYYPRCSSKNFTVGMDATPSYLSSKMAPLLMHARYKLFSNRLDFLVILRSPLYRMRSAFYHAKDKGGCSRNVNLCKSFGNYVARALANNRQGCPSGKSYSSAADVKKCSSPDDCWDGGHGDPFHLSFYVPQLENWFYHFEPMQFVIAPMLTYVAPFLGLPSLVEFMARRIGSAIRPNMLTDAIEKGAKKGGHSHDYPSLANDLKGLDKTDEEELGRILTEKAGPEALAKLLSPKMAEGLVLFGYPGNLNDTDAIGKFISNSW